MTEFKIAVVGAGSMAREHIRAFGSLSGITVEGVHSRTRSRAEDLSREYGISVVADQVDELAERTKAGLVVIAVPELEANRVAKACFRHDWAVLMEKPAGYDLGDAEDIAAAQGGEKSVMVAFNRRFYSSTLAVKGDIDSRPDEARFIHVQDQQSFVEARQHNHPEKVVERFMYANSIHNIDFLMNFGRGEVTNITPLMPWKGEDTEVVLVHVEFDSGDSGLYEGIWKGPGPWACSVSTPSKRWTMQPMETAQFQNAGERGQQQIEISKDDADFKPGFRLQAEAAVRKARGEKVDNVDLEESLRVMRLINRMFGC